MDHPNHLQQEKPQGSLFSMIKDTDGSHDRGGSRIPHGRGALILLRGGGRSAIRALFVKMYVKTKEFGLVGGWGAPEIFDLFKVTRNSSWLMEWNN